jgi:hypothetical protein
MLVLRSSAHDALIEVDRPLADQGEVVPGMCLRRGQLKVLRPVVQGVVVDVMHDLVAFQRSADDAFNDDAMFVAPTCRADLDLPVDAPAIAAQTSASDRKGTGMIHAVVIACAFTPAMRALRRVALSVSLELAQRVVLLLQGTAASASAHMLHGPNFINRLGTLKWGVV